METQVEEPGTDAEPGPRLARTLAEQAAAAEAKAARRRRAVGIVIVVVGLAVAAYAAWSAFASDGSSERKVGKLTASHLDGDPTSKVASSAPKGTGSSSSTGSKSGNAGTSGTSGGTGTSATTEPGKPAPGTRHWPAAVYGRPKAFGARGDAPPASAGSLDPGYYVWSDFDGFHVWLVGGSDADAVTVTMDDPYNKAEAVGGSVDLTTAKNSFTLRRGSASEEVVGVDFSPGFYAKNIIVAVDGDLQLHTGSRAYKAQPYYGMRLETT